MLVLISPSHGSAETRRHWADTVERPVDFMARRYDGLLASEQRESLLALHPEARARFWGATPAHDGKFADVTTGDVVLFTGQNRVRAIGEVWGRSSAIARSPIVCGLRRPVGRAGTPSTASRTWLRRTSRTRS